MRILFTAVFLNFFFFTALAQSTYVPLDPDTYHRIDRFLIKFPDKAPNLHTGIKPYFRKEVAELAQEVIRENDSLSRADQFNATYLLNDNWNYTNRVNQTNYNKPFLKYFFRQPADFYSVDVPDFTLRVNPVVHFEAGRDTRVDGMRYVNTRGIQVEGQLDEKLGFYTFIAENQARFPDYVNDRIVRDTILPHEGYFKPFRTVGYDPAAGYDFTTARGYINYAASKHLSLQLGHDRNFIGNGYRSLVLSDYAPAYFFLKFNVNVWKLQYTNLFTEMNADYEFRDQLLPKKYFAYHHLGVNITPNVNVGVFESVIYARDKGHFELEYLNPIIFYRSVELMLGSNDNALLGLDFKANVFKTAQVYGQLMLDEFSLPNVRARNGWWGNKQAFQLGAKYIDVAKINNLDAQVEFNFIRPYTYQHENKFTNYQHYQQPLAHPMGANLYEWIGILRYQPLGRLNLTAKAFYTHYGADTDTLNYGNNVLLSYNNRAQEYNNKVGQGLTTDQLHVELTASWQLRHNMFLDVKQILRKVDSQMATRSYNSAYTTVAFRWNIPQRLHEF
ncbi:hypothetical protein [Adhaeribacter pallidiroseus]|uniref:Capsule assembly Wzi family protein n=1 Tax=Adhaeribacter pallidiroseus TaxID=2072847 RepID=A0A369QDY0_9BACT|nr:hypothetical protein [Adhaeribacter pallidiroseus]RDC61457.1 hypothetical protein AHMF7616_00036 [Adhaeribacter pallidiroseus]